MDVLASHFKQQFKYKYDELLLIHSSNFLNIRRLYIHELLTT